MPPGLYKIHKGLSFHPLDVTFIHGIIHGNGNAFTFYATMIIPLTKGVQIRVHTID